MRNPFRYLNSSPEIIRPAVMMYVRYPLSLRQVEDLLFERGIDVCHETVRCWWNHFGPLFAGEKHYLWRAVDHEGEVLEIVTTKGRGHGAALKFPKRTMKRYGRPASIVTDRLRSYRAAMNVIGNAAAQTSGSLAQQPGGKLATAVSKAGRGDGAVQRYQDPAEIRLRSRLDPPPLQPPTPSQPPRHFQTRPSRRRGRVATTRSLRTLDRRFYRPDAVSLTMPCRECVVRDAVQEDFTDIAGIYAWHVRHGLASFEIEPPEREVLIERWRKVYGEGLPWLVAEADGRVEGYAYGTHYRPRPAYRFTVENSVYVRPGRMRMGTGRVLMATLVEAVHKSGLPADDCGDRGFGESGVDQLS